MDEEQALSEVQRLEEEEHRLLARVERLRAELAEAEAEHARIQQANMRARRSAITSEPPPPRPES